MSTPLRQQIYIYDHPESKIRFLEMTQADTDWRATIVHAKTDPDAEQHQQAIASKLKNRGYTISKGKDTEGNLTLSIHHFGSDTSLKSVIQEDGLVRGLGHLVMHPEATFGRAFSYGGNWVIDSLRTPARANGLINSVAEVFISGAGFAAKYGKFSDPKNALISVAGLSWLSQSLVYLGFAKNNEEQALARIQKKLTQTMEKGEDITQVRYDATRDRESTGFIHRTKAFLERSPVVIGAVASNVGMLAFIGASVLERKFQRGQLALNPMNKDALAYVGNGTRGFRAWLKTGFGKDVFGAILSLTAWTFMMIPPKKREELGSEDPHKGILRRMWDSVRERPQVLGGLGALSASSFRLMGATTRGNWSQQIGEKIYIGGDIALMFTNSHEYGGDAKLDPEKLTSKVIDYVRKLPFLLGEKEQADFVEHNVQYWMDKQLADMAQDKKSRAVPRQQIEESAIELRQALSRQLHHLNAARLEHLCQCVAETTMRFPEAERPALIEKLATSLCSQKWLRASCGEIQLGIQKALTTLPAQDYTLSEATLAHDIMVISRIVPNSDAPATTAALYDVLAPFTRHAETAPPARPNPTVHAVTRLTPVAALPMLAKA